MGMAGKNAMVAAVAWSSNVVVVALAAEVGDGDRTSLIHYG